MERIKFHWFYTTLVEHYFRMAVRYKTVSRESSQRWFALTKKWINSLNEEDKHFINFVFSRQFFNTAEGLYCFKSTDDMEMKRTRLAILEKEFALATGLIGEADDENEMKMSETAYLK